ncbi:MAG: ATP-binding cassette domain-containing protein [Peptostreptococcaceae bacterium]|nr:ATP-binding cassette domain-containing protein [Peptostreptococcaceae bacterium]
MDLLVSLQNATKRLGERTILNSTSIDFKEGEITAIVAPNGTGKTTTINLISGFMSVDEGELVFSEDLTYKDVAVVFGGDKNLYMKNTVEENIYYLSMMKGLTKSQIQSNIEKLNELIPHYEELSKKMCEHLSHGQKRMAAIFAGGYKMYLNSNSNTLAYQGL